MAANNHTELAAAVRQLYALVTAATGAAPEGDAARFAAVAGCVVTEAEGIGRASDGGAGAVGRLLLLLELLEDSALAMDGQDAQKGIFKAIAAVQEALGVPDGQRAWATGADAELRSMDAQSRADVVASWVKRASEARREPCGVCFANIALSLLPLLEEAVGEALARDPVNRESCLGLLRGAGSALTQAVNARTEAECWAALKAADVFVGDAPHSWEADTVDADRAWGLYYGIGEAIRLGQEASENELKRAG